MVTHLPLGGMPDGERCMTSANGGGTSHIIITEKCVVLLAGWLSKIEEKFSPMELPTFGGKHLVLTVT